MLKKFLVAALFGLTIFHLRDPFSPRFCDGNGYIPPLLPNESLYTTALEFDQAISQEFHYLGKGNQSFVFESRDGRYVLKLFKHHFWKMPQLPVPVPKILSSYWERKEQKRTIARDAAYTSFAFMADDMKEACALVYLHLTKGEIRTHPVLLQDRIGRRFSIDISEYPFILQKKGICLDHVLDQCLQKNDLLGAKKAIAALLNLQIERFSKGISDKDPHIFKNYGFVNGKPFALDTGNMTKDPLKDDTYLFGWETEKILFKALPTFEKRYPLLLPSFIQMIEWMKKERTAIPETFIESI